MLCGGSALFMRIYLDENFLVANFIVLSFFVVYIADLIFYAYLWLKETLKPNAMIASILIFIVSWLIVGGLIIGLLYRILWFLWRVFYDDPKNDRHFHSGFRPF